MDARRSKRSKRNIENVIDNTPNEDPIDARRSKRSKRNIENVINNTPNEDPAIFRLNEDCMRQIFSFLTIKERIRLARVCKNWQAFVKLSWNDIKELKISFFCEGDQHKIKYTLPILKQVLSYCGNSLTNLTLIDWQGKAFSKPDVTFIRKTCPNLKFLNLSSIMLSRQVIEVLADSYSDLTHISLGRCHKGCSEAASKLFLNNKQLKSVEFYECQLLHEQCLSQLPADSIESLLFCDDCGESVVRSMRRCLKNYTKLKSLSISQCDQLIQILNDLLEKLPNKSNLETLILEAYEPQSPDVISNISSFINLRKIILSYGFVNDDLLTFIQQHCKNLRSVHLSNSTALTDSGFKNLLGSPSIEELCIKSLTGISDKSFASMNMPLLKSFECCFISKLTNKTFRLLMLASNNLSRIKVKNCDNVDIDILINDVLRYTSNRPNQDILKLIIEDDNSSPAIRNIYPRLVVILTKKA